MSPSSVWNFVTGDRCRSSRAGGDGSQSAQTVVAHCEPILHFAHVAESPHPQQSSVGQVQRVMHQRSQFVRSAFNDVCDQAGTSGFMRSPHLQRFRRELAVLSSHAFYDYDRLALSYGQVLLEGSLPEGEMA